MNDQKGSSIGSSNYPNDTKRANMLRLLGLEAIEKAQSGHGGMVLGMAEIAQTLFSKHLKFNPNDPSWLNRDRFILSNGHGSMLLYGLLHFCGYPLSLEDIKQFRQLGSKTPGHPESHITPGVEVTTGPLGQGLAMAVGCALAQKKLAATLNTSHSLIDYRTWVFVGDGCLMEGVSYEACSLAGTLQVDNLIAVYDDNRITIDGPTDGWFTESTPNRFKAMGWTVIEAVDGHDVAAIDQAFEQAKAVNKGPVLIVCRTTIGKGVEHLEHQAKAHANPVGAEIVSKMRQDMGFGDEPFAFQDEEYALWQREDNQQAYQQWVETYADWKDSNAKLANHVARGNILSGEVIKVVTDALQEDWGTLASRVAHAKITGAILPHAPMVLGGSADLGGSTGTWTSESKAFDLEQPDGNYLHYGVREFAMGAIANGLATSPVRPYVGTFLTFSDYCRPAVRLSSLMELPVNYVFTHDSVALGEDGPTHQPVEHVASLRAIPNLQVWRPGNNAETIAAVYHSHRTSSPSAFILSRQGLANKGKAVTIQNEEQAQAFLDLTEQGGYIALDPSSTPELTIFTSGSELTMAFEVAEKFQQENIAVRIISCPCHELLKSSNPAWLQNVREDTSIKVGIEAGSSLGFDQGFFALNQVIGIDSFGTSAPGSQALEHFGFSTNRLHSQLSLWLRTERI